MSNPDTDIKRTGFFQAFIDHPASVDETYLEHAWFALRFAGTLFAAGGAALIHAVIPPLFESTASRLIQKMHNTLQDRH